MQAQLNTGGSTQTAIAAAASAASAAQGTANTAVTNAATAQTTANTAVSNASAVASTVSTVQARLDSGDYAAVKTEANASAGDIVGLKARYGVKVDVNGHVVGFEILDGSSSGSFVILADKLLIAKPDGSGTPIPMLSLGTVNGLTDLGLDGSLIVDGSIVARSINTNGLAIRDALGNVILSSGVPLTSPYITPSSTWLNSNVTYAGLPDAKPPTNADNTASNTAAGIYGQGAFATLSQINTANVSTYIGAAAIDTAYIANAAIKTALIDNLAVTTGKIANLAVDTLQVAGNAITVPVGNYTEASITTSATTFTEVQSVTIDAGSAPISIIGACYCKNNSVSVAEVNIRLVRDGTVVYNGRSSGLGASQSTSMVAQYEEAPGTGSHTYSMQIGPTTTINISTTSRSLLCIGLKK